MNLSREALKKLIHESLKELTQERDEGPGINVGNLENVEKEVSAELGAYLAGRGKSIVTKVKRASATIDGKARMLTLIAGLFGIRALDAKSNLGKASDSLSKPQPGNESPKT